MGLVWWWVAPTEEWTVVEDGALVPADLGFDAWFAADGWFLVLGVVAGVLLTLISLAPRAPDAGCARSSGCSSVAALLRLTAWALGGALGRRTRRPSAETAEVGSHGRGCARPPGARGAVRAAPRRPLTALAPARGQRSCRRVGGRGSDRPADGLGTAAVRRSRVLPRLSP